MKECVCEEFRARSGEAVIMPRKKHPPATLAVSAESSQNDHVKNEAGVHRTNSLSIHFSIVTPITFVPRVKCAAPLIHTEPPQNESMMVQLGKNVLMQSHDNDATSLIWHFSPPACFFFVFFCLNK